MSLIFWRKTRDIRPENASSVAVTEDTPLPVRPIQGEDDAALAVSLETIPVAIYYPIDHETVTVAATAVGLTLSKYQNADRAFITLETAQIRFRYDGAAAPTSSTGHILDVAVPLTLDGPETMARFQAIRTGSTSGTLTVTYEKRRQ